MAAPASHEVPQSERGTACRFVSKTSSRDDDAYLCIVIAAREAGAQKTGRSIFPVFAYVRTQGVAAATGPYAGMTEAPVSWAESRGCLHKHKA
ncbi:MULTISPECIES: hypothetical protein [Paenibacillus]|uniref:hypothetical protein n=1 Tax=Paenibacillus TaxID=44249 RepID=UPI0022B8B3E9|nr:hypothetical protein [Paenibacillus caseinilyticus]MCZ8519360.1 hypothetical protein [Paenibacillus caseinilyticus]